MRRVFLGLGSNIEPKTSLMQGVQHLKERFELRQMSPWYGSRAFGFEGPDFINLVVEIAYAGELECLVRELKAIEILCGRPLNAQKFTSRTLDIDILLFGELCGTFAGMRLPRPEVRKRAYVLRPLADIHAQGQDPQTGETWAALAQSLDMSSLKLVDSQE